MTIKKRKNAQKSGVSASRQFDFISKSARVRSRRSARQQTSRLDFTALESRYLLAGITVTNATDLVSPAADTSSIPALIANDGGDGISLREAITASNNTSGEDTITFDGGVFSGGANSLIRLTQGELEITESLTIDASTATDVTITGDADGDDVTIAGTFITDVAASFGGTAGDADGLLDDNSRVLNFSSETGDLTLNSLTITGGRTTDAREDGGGVRFDSSGALAIESSLIAGNSTSGFGSDGGGIRVFGDLTLTQSIVNGNGTSGGTSFGGGGISALRDVELVQSTVSNNSTSGFSAPGGGIFVVGNASLHQSTVSGNSTVGGGAAGGGIFAEGDVRLNQSTVSGNSTSGPSANGGGIATANNSNSTVEIIQSTVSSNSTSAAGSNGGGLYTNALVTIDQSTLTGNTAANASGGAISIGFGFSRSISITNSIVSGNTALDGQSILLPITLPPTITYSLIDSSIIPNPYTSGNNYVIDNPLLAPLADNGGPTLTHALLPGSNAINNGSNALNVAVTGEAFPNDQRGEGFDRIQVGTIDIGAFESSFDGVVPPTIVSTTINEGGVLARPDLLNTLKVVFSTDLSVSVDALNLFNDSPAGGIQPLDLAGIGFSYDPSTFTAIWDFTTLEPLGAGFYTYQLDARPISVDGVVLDGDGDGFQGGDFEDQIYVAIPGDANLDGTVDVLNDAFTLIGNLNTTSGALFTNGDFNGDGQVNILGDALILIANLNRNVDLITDVIVSNNSDVTNGDTSSVFALIKNDGGDGISLREAIIASNNAIGSGTITFDESVFTGGADSLIRLTQGELFIDDGVTIDGSSATDVTITGDANGDDVTISGTFITDVDASFGEVTEFSDNLLDDNSRVISFSGPESSTLVLDSLTVTGGRPTSNSHGGGGIYSDAGSISLNNSRVSGNSTSGVDSDGGGIGTSSGNVSVTNTTISGNSTSGIFYSDGGGISTVSGSISLTDSIISGNKTSGDQSYGGGVYSNSGEIFLANSNTSGNSTSGNASFGGGISTFSGDILLTNSSISGNTTNGYGSRGGGVYSAFGEISSANSTISGNSTSGTYSQGGGIATSSDRVSLINSTVSGNTTNGFNSDGGGISSYSSAVYLIGSTVSGNSTSGGNQSDGGGIFTYRGFIFLTDSNVNGNTATGFGGGIETYRGYISLTNSTLSENSSDAQGGGIYASSGYVSLTNSTLSGNTSTGNGGGIGTRYGTVSVTNSTITENSATSGVGGGIAFDSPNPDSVQSLTIRNSIVAGNGDNGTAADIFAPSDAANNLTIDHSLIGDTTGSGIAATTGTGNILNQSASLGPLADNGGPTLTHALLVGSPAINAGDNTQVTGDDFLLETDQRGEGFDRIFGSSVDIGAFELQPVAATAQLVLAGDDDLRDDIFGSEF